MDPVDRIIKEHSVVARPVLRVFLGFVGDSDLPPGQEFAVKAINLFSAPCPQRDVVDANGLVVVL
jgi:hypothetical protein